ncbi:uncharacterized protein BJX67DRAFT_344516 [Aspergillus lucknowensis]|uniref:Uncharacterized protein n=1 Tax=Aspergillus lucknowensis TaxID=176173 RepID=A0ABR4M1R9_9EURO
MQADNLNKYCLHRTAVSQVLVCILQALAAEAPSQEWHDRAQEKLLTWEVKYMDILQDIPKATYKELPASNYWPSNWKPYLKDHNTRSREQCQPDLSTPKPSSSEGSGSDKESPSPSTMVVVRSRSSRGRGNNHQPIGGREGTQSGRDSRKNRLTTRPYCTMACIQGIINQDPLDKGCPNLQDYLQYSSGQRHLISYGTKTRDLSPFMSVAAWATL